MVHEGNPTGFTVSCNRPVATDCPYTGPVDLRTSKLPLCRKARSSLQLHHGSTDGTGTRPSLEPR
jgi:hypothetical protein